MLAGVQYLRAFAAILVVIHHAQYWQETYGNGSFKLGLKFGTGGVDIFFILSGFIITYIIRQKTQTPAQFITARILRVAPLYWMYLLAFIIIHPETTNAIHSLKSFLFVPSHHPDFSATSATIWPPLIQGWTLNYEMFFYVLLSICMGIGRPVAAVCVTIPILVVGGIIFQPQSAVAVTYTSPMLLEFLAGVTLATIYMNRFHPPLGLGIAFLACGLALFPILSAHPVPDVSGVTWVFNRGAPALLIVAGTLVLEKSNAIPSFRWPLLGGASSYTLYLSHVFVLELLVNFWRLSGLRERVGDGVLLVIAIAMSILVGLALYSLIERPVLEALRMRSSSRMKERSAARPQALLVARRANASVARSTDMSPRPRRR
jgi:exopolysaccharide production protein ExoZ